MRAVGVRESREIPVEVFRCAVPFAWQGTGTQSETSSSCERYDSAPKIIGDRIYGNSPAV